MRQRVASGGVNEIFTMGAQTTDIIDYIRKVVQRARA
jgi:hypothetical protein